MFYHKLWFIKGAVMSAESIRRSQAGSIMMACFIDTASGYWESIPARLTTLQTMNDILGKLIPGIAAISPWLVPAYLDLEVGIQ